MSLRASLLLTIALLASPAVAEAGIFGCWRHHERCGCSHHRRAATTYSTPTSTPSQFVTIDATELLTRWLEERSRRTDSRDDSGSLGDLGDRMSKLESSFDALESKLDSRLEEIGEAVATLSKNQTEAVNELESRVTANSELIQTNAELVLANARELQRLVRETNLGVTHRVKAGAAEDNRRVFFSVEDVENPPAAQAFLPERLGVRVLRELDVDGETYAEIRYVSERDGEEVQEAYVRRSVLEAK